MIQVIKLSFKEMMNKRIVHLGLLFTLAYLLVYGTGLHYLLKEYHASGNQFWFIQQLGYQFLSLGWYISTFLVGAMVIMAGSGSIAREIESGTILSLASKPLSRTAILGGKFCAYSLVGILYSVILLAAVAGLVRYYFRLLIDPLSLLQGIAIFMLFPLLILAVTQLFSSRLSTMATGVISFMLYAVAIIGGFIEQMGALMHNTGMINIGVFSSLLLPADAIYRMAVSHAGGMLGGATIADFGPFGAASIPSNWMIVYSIGYIIVMLSIAIVNFNRRDL